MESRWARSSWASPSSSSSARVYWAIRAPESRHAWSSASACSRSPWLLVPMSSPNSSAMPVSGSPLPSTRSPSCWRCWRRCWERSSPRRVIAPCLPGISASSPSTRSTSSCAFAPRASTVSSSCASTWMRLSTVSTLTWSWRACSSRRRCTDPRNSSSCSPVGSASSAGRPRSSLAIDSATAICPARGSWAHTGRKCDRWASSMPTISRASVCAFSSETLTMLCASSLPVTLENFLASHVARTLRPSGL